MDELLHHSNSVASWCANMLLHDPAQRRKDRNAEPECPVRSPLGPECLEGEAAVLLSG